MPLDVRPIAGALGAEIHGADLARPLDEQDFATIRQALLDYLVVFFRDQDLTPDQLKAFGRHFGAVRRQPFIEPMAEHPEVIEIIKEAEEVRTQTFGSTWHSDLSFLPQPPLASVLYAREAPAYGGDTNFVNMVAAYEALSDGMKAMIAEVRAVHCGARYFGSKGGFFDRGGRFGGRGLRSIRIDHSEEADQEAVHPLVLRQPETGRQALFLNEIYTQRFDGMHEAESRPLIDYLCRHVRSPEFTCRFRWDTGSLAMWDNRVTQHCAINDYDGQRRHMWRIAVEGERLP